MRTIGWLALGLISVGMPGPAGGDEGDLSSRSRAIAANKALEAPSAPAPFAKPQEGRETLRLSVGIHTEAPTRGLPCAAQAVCYDTRQGHIVYRGAREYMPRLQGLTPEGVALRQDRLILRYSFR